MWQPAGMPRSAPPLASSRAVFDWYRAFAAFAAATAAAAEFLGYPPITIANSYNPQQETGSMGQ